MNQPITTASKKNLGCIRGAAARQIPPYPAKGLSSSSHLLLVLNLPTLPKILDTNTMVPGSQIDKTFSMLSEKIADKRYLTSVFHALNLQNVVA